MNWSSLEYSWYCEDYLDCWNDIDHWQTVWKNRIAEAIQKQDMQAARYAVDQWRKYAQ